MFMSMSRSASLISGEKGAARSIGSETSACGRGGASRALDFGACITLSATAASASPTGPKFN
jgi:hypothetical protein